MMVCMHVCLAYVYLCHMYSTSVYVYIVMLVCMCAYYGSHDHCVCWCICVDVCVCSRLCAGVESVDQCRLNLQLFFVQDVPTSNDRNTDS